MIRLYIIFLVIHLPFISVSNASTYPESSLQSSTLKDTTIIGRVVDIIDGDTFKLLTKDSILLKIRLANIDCPEKKQPFSTRAKQFTSDAIFGKNIRIVALKKDRYRRYIANVYYDDKILNIELIRNGLAWHFVKYSNDENLQGVEDAAKKKKKGVWSEKNPIAPWDWRKGIRSGNLQQRRTNQLIKLKPKT